MKIVVFGLGYVGCVTAACFAKEGHSVVGIDISSSKVEMINSGNSPIIEPGLGEIIREVVGQKKLIATLNYQEALKDADISLVCVGTPSQRNGNVNLEYIFRVAEQIGGVIKEIQKYHLFVIRSTVPPGTLEKSLNIIAELSGKKIGQDFSGCSNPEFLREGTAIKDFYKPPFTIIGEWDKKSGEYLAKIYQTIDAPLMRTNVRVSEILKYINNVFHALKVAFGNEVGTLCKSYNIDSHEVMDLFCLDDKLNLSGYYLKPGFAFGGSCLPKDVRAFTYQGKMQDLNLPLINSVMESNENHIRRAIDLILSQNKKKVGILGLSFKGGTDDLRESPMVEVVETLIGKGYDVRIYDKNVQLAKIFGANKEYIENKIPHISKLMVDNIDEIIDHAELLLIGNKSKDFEKIIQKNSNSKIIIDLVRIVENIRELRENYIGLCW